VKDALRGARAAFVFLTRFPVGGHPYLPVEWAWAPAAFPLVGLVLGAALAVLHRLLWPLGSLADASLVLAASLLMTGALHEDGLADSFDALGGATDRDRVLEILKDSRVGSFGACALVVSIVGRAVLLARLGEGARWALPLVASAARVAPVWQMSLLPYVTRSEAKSAALMAAGPPQAAWATAWAIGALAVAVTSGGLTMARALVLVAMLGATTIWTARVYAARVGGVTGDFLGATEQCGELVGYAVLAWAA
jgi:adenosylcobinamide-GDP ribazoletransferase